MLTDYQIHDWRGVHGTGYHISVRVVSSRYPKGREVAIAYCWPGARYLLAGRRGYSVLVKEGVQCANDLSV